MEVYILATVVFSDHLTSVALGLVALHDAATFPGVMLACKPLAVVDVDQKAKGGGREANPRLILMPTWHDRLASSKKLLSCRSG